MKTNVCVAPGDATGDLLIDIQPSRRSKLQIRRPRLGLSPRLTEVAAADGGGRHRLICQMETSMNMNV